MKINVSEKIVDSLVSIGVVPPEDKDLYEYGMRQGIVMIINVLSVIIVGLIMGMVWQSIVFLLAYFPIRAYAGGYHARTQWNCYLLSLALVIAVLFEIRLIPWNGYICIIISFCAGIIVFFLAPVEDANKPLLQREIIIYKRRARIIFSILVVAAFVFWVVGSKQISISIVMALETIAVMLILGAIKNSRDIKGESVEV